MRFHARLYPWDMSCKRRSPPCLYNVSKYAHTVEMSMEPSQLLRERGLYVTPQRLAVLRVVRGRPHLTADEIVELVRADIGAVSRRAIYDGVGLLADLGLLRRIQPAGSATLYEDRVADNHHHLVCRICGQLVDVDCAVGHKPCLTAADDSGYEIDEAEVTFWGRCPECVVAGSP
jgi:Fur family ferric uptake transcriptional regulator